MIMHLLTGLIGTALLAAFLGILMWWIQELPLVIIMVGVILLMLYDLLQTLRYGEGWAERK